MIASAIVHPELLLQGRYRVVRQIGGGGFSQVFEVDDGGTPKVLKILNLERFQDPEIKNKAIILFQREAEFLSRQRHPGIPRVEPTGYFTWSEANHAPLHCLVMEKIAGPNLQEWMLARGNQPITTEEAIAWLTQLAKILDQLHKQHYFHRDIKPSNIMLRTPPTPPYQEGERGGQSTPPYQVGERGSQSTPPYQGGERGGQLVLVDFGAVREVTETYLLKHEGNETGTVIISAGYTPPEQIEGYAVPQSDFFALGRTFVCLLTGKSPLDFPKDPETGQLIWRDRSPQVSPQLADLIDSLMAPFTGGRPQNAQAILEYLAEIQPHSRPSWRNFVQKLPIARSPADKHTAGTKLGLRLSRGVKLTVAGLLLLGGTSLWKLSPQIAIAFNEQGAFDYKMRNWDSAQFYYRLALLLDSKNAKTNYNLGLLYEDQHKLDQAGAAYQIATQGGLDKGYNNLARLYILDKQYTTAVSLLQKGLSLAEDNKGKYALRKNLGWAQLELGRYTDAQANLQKAIDLDKNRAPAYCLKAQVLERQQNKQGAISDWQNCLKYANPQNSDEKSWMSLAPAELKTKRTQ